MFNLPVSRDAFAITPSDSAANIATYLRVGAVGGALKVTTLGGNDIVLTVLANEYIPLSVTKVWATGTVATGIIGFR